MPTNDPVTDDMRNAAANLVQAALEACPTCTLDIEAAKKRVAGTLAASGHPIKVEFETNDDGSHCLYIDAEPSVQGCSNRSGDTHDTSGSPEPGSWFYTL